MSCRCCCGCAHAAMRLPPRGTRLGAATGSGDRSNEARCTSPSLISGGVRFERSIRPATRLSVRLLGARSPARDAAAGAWPPTSTCSADDAPESAPSRPLGESVARIDSRHSLPYRGTLALSASPGASASLTADIVTDTLRRSCPPCRAIARESPLGGTAGNAVRLLPPSAFLGPPAFTLGLGLGLADAPYRAVTKGECGGTTGVGMGAADGGGDDSFRCS